MLNDRFVHTFRFPTCMADGYENGRYVVFDTTLTRFVESKLPTLKGKPYNICF